MDQRCHTFSFGHYHRAPGASCGILYILVLSLMQSLSRFSFTFISRVSTCSSFNVTIINFMFIVSGISAESESERKDLVKQFQLLKDALQKEVKAQSSIQRLLSELQATFYYKLPKMDRIDT